MKLKIIEENDKTVIVELDGRLDSEGIMLVNQSLAEHIADKNAIIDMCRVEYMASLGIRMLLQLAKDAKKHGKKIVIANPQTLVLGVLELANIGNVIAIFPSIKDAKRFI